LPFYQFETVMLYVILIISVSFGASGAFVIQKYGANIGLTDHPNQRSSHVLPVPKGGGIGISGAFAVCCLILGIPFLFWLPPFLMSLVSFGNDRVDISARIRLLIQLFLAGIMAYGVLILQGYQETPLYLWIVAVIFITGTANFYNFMDGINGIAAITGIVGFGLLALYGKSSGYDARFVGIALAVCVSCAGFLPFNFPRARAFMGDAGSILLGFVFAGIVLVFSENMIDFVVMAGFMFPFYADEIITMIIRIKHGDSLLKPHRKHIYQILVNEMGIDHWKISVLFGVIQLLVGVSLIMMKSFGMITLLCFFTLCFGMMVFFRTCLGKIRLSP